MDTLINNPTEFDAQFKKCCKTLDQEESIQDLLTTTRALKNDYQLIGTGVKVDEGMKSFFEERLLLGLKSLLKKNPTDGIESAFELLKIWQGFETRITEENKESYNFISEHFSGEFDTAPLFVLFNHCEKANLTDIMIESFINS